MSIQNRGKKQIMDAISFNHANVPKRYIKRRGEMNGGWKESCLLGTTESCDFDSKVGTSVAFDKAMVVTSPEWVLFSFGLWLLINLHVATQARRVGVGLGKLAVEPDGVVSWELWEPAENYVADEISEW